MQGQVSVKHQFSCPAVLYVIIISANLEDTMFTGIFDQVKLERCCTVTVMKQVQKAILDQALQQSRIEMSTVLKYL